MSGCKDFIDIVNLINDDTKTAEKLSFYRHIVSCNDCKQELSIYFQIKKAAIETFEADIDTRIIFENIKNEHEKSLSDRSGKTLKLNIRSICLILKYFLPVTYIQIPYNLIVRSIFRSLPQRFQRFSPINL
jgi:hypothetical protein